MQQQVMQPAPSVIINQPCSPGTSPAGIEGIRRFAGSTHHAVASARAEASSRAGSANPEQAVDSSKPTITLLAFKDSTVVAAIA
ncbi:MAG: hypothetical protein U0R19_02065 [Bryobacteraceae bacterium]